MIAIRKAILALLASGAVFGPDLTGASGVRGGVDQTVGPPGAGQINVGVQIDGAQVHFSYLSLKDYIQMAYGVKGHQVLGPDWLAPERFEIAATLPAGAAREQVAGSNPSDADQRSKLMADYAL